MAKSRDAVSLWGAMLTPGLYKRNQGRLTRQLTGVGIVVVTWFAAWTGVNALSGIEAQGTRVGIALGITAVGAWVAFALVNWPRFADFLISVQAEMDKVSWSSKAELYRATVVVIATMFFLAAILLAFDVFWVWLFRLLGILQTFEGEAG